MRSHLMEALDGVAPSTFEHQFIPLWDQVVDGTSSMRLAEGSAAVHAARRLNRSLHIVVARIVDLSPVENALKGVTVRVRVAVVVDEPSGLVDGPKSAVPALNLGRVIGGIGLVPPYLVVLAHGEASLLCTCSGGRQAPSGRSPSRVDDHFSDTA